MQTIRQEGCRLHRILPFCASPLERAAGHRPIGKEGMIDSVDKFLVLREPLGDLRQIFPEIPAGKVERKTTTDAIYEEIVTNDYFVVRIGDYAISSDTVSRIYSVAKKNCRPETLDKVQDAR